MNKWSIESNNIFHARHPHTASAPAITRQSVQKMFLPLMPRVILHSVSFAFSSHKVYPLIMTEYTKSSRQNVPERKIFGLSRRLFCPRWLSRRFTTCAGYALLLVIVVACGRTEGLFQLGIGLLNMYQNIMKCNRRCTVLTEICFVNV